MKTKVLILTNRLMAYRIPIFNMLGEKYNLTVAYSIGTEPIGTYKFNVVNLPVWQYGRFVIHKQNIHKFASTFDVVIYTGDIAWLKYALLPFKSRKYKTICWSIGVSASYDKEFDSVKKWDSIRDFFYSKSDALLFYSEYPINKYLARGFDREKLFVAHNTVQVLDTIDITTKNSFLFIGTLYKAKGLDELLEAYKAVCLRQPNLWPLKIVGGGEGYEDVKQWVIQNGLESQILLVGPVYDELNKEMLFKSSVLCVSPNQAGLGVLESMAHGTVFVTKETSITGGERLNIENGKNGILYNDPKELEHIITDAYLNPLKYKDIGMRAKDYYNRCRTPKIMLSGFDAAISYVLNKQ